MSELFPPEQVSVESPRMKWLKKNMVFTAHHVGYDESSKKWGAWAISEENPRLGFGPTEVDAIADWARKNNVRLWNEE